MVMGFRDDLSKQSLRHVNKHMQRSWMKEISLSKSEAAKIKARLVK